MKNLLESKEEVSNQYADLASYIVPTEQVRLTESGQLNTGKNEFSLTHEANEQFAHLLKIPRQFYPSLETDIRAIIFNRRFPKHAKEAGLGNKIRIHLNNNQHIIGYDDPSLLRINPVKVVDLICSSLPSSISAQEISVSRLDLSPRRLHISCFSPEKVSEPRKGDIINGGIDIIHDTSGNEATKIFCYLRRLICKNGAVSHVCSEDTSLRTRRLNNGRFDEDDMLRQLGERLTEAWGQLDEKLSAVNALLEKKRISLEFLSQQRTRFSLNNKILQAIENAINQDEFGPTNTQYDIFNALSRVATHREALSFRQRRTLSRMAGEFSQHAVHKCNQCGSWVMSHN